MSESLFVGIYELNFEIWILDLFRASPARFSKLPPVKRVALFYGQRLLNKGSTKVLMFPFATLCEARDFQSKQSVLSILLGDLGFLLPWSVNHGP